LLSVGIEQKYFSQAPVLLDKLKVFCVIMVVKQFGLAPLRPLV